MTGRGSSPRYLPLLFVLKRLMNWRVEKRPWEWEQMPGDFGSVSGEQRGCSLFPRLSARLLFWLTSASAWDATSAPATKHTSSSTPHTTALLLLLLLQATAATALGHHLLLDHVDDLVRDAEVLDGAATDVTLRHPPEFVPIPGCADHLTQVDVHPVVTAHQMPIIRLPVFELYQHWVILSCFQQRQGKSAAFTGPFSRSPSSLASVSPSAKWEDCCQTAIL